MATGWLVNMICCELTVSDQRLQLIYYRCMEHSLHIAAKHFVETVAPASSSSFRQPAFGGNESDSDDLDDLTSGDSLGKALALVKQVSFPFKILPSGCG